MESGWRAADTVFTAPEFQRRYPKVEVSLLTPKVALVPTAFFDEAKARETLSETVALGNDDEVGHIGLPEYAAELVYSLSIGEMLSRAISQAVLDGEGKAARILPEMYFILKDLQKVDEYNRIVASYFLFMAVRKLQLNPEVSSVYFRTPLKEEEMMSLYRYFKSVERL